jgi:hypothetical protein
MPVPLPPKIRTVLPFILAVCFAMRSHAADLVEVVKRVEKAVVRINTDDGSFGSGVVINDDGLILTNYHVIEGASSVEIVLRSGEKRTCAGYLLVDPKHDLATLRIGPVAAGSALKLKAEMPSVGEKVAAFGNPQGFSFTTSEGIVSAIRKGKEVHDTIGQAYKDLGFAIDATWIQTTAAISGGNSGGPLVTMNSEVVGLNTWGDDNGQQLNFAISLIDIKRYLDQIKPGLPLKGFDTLPKARSTPVAGNWYGPLEPFRLEFPTGRVFAFEVFKTKTSDLEQLSTRRDPNLVLISHANGALYAAAQQQQGVLHGLTVGQWDNREPMVHAMYAEGRRHGLLKLWDEAGEPLMYCQYERGKRSGFTCLFDDAIPVLIAQYRMDRIEYLQLMSFLTPREGFDSQEEALKNPKAKAHLARLDKLDAELKKNEVQFRRQVKDFEDERRRDLAAKLAPEKRARASQRAKDRAAANDKFLQEMRRRTHGF